MLNLLGGDYMKKFLLVLLFIFILTEVTGCKNDSNIDTVSENTESESVLATFNDEAEMNNNSKSEVEVPSDNNRDNSNLQIDEKANKKVDIHVKQISLNTYETKLVVGKSFMPKVTMLPLNATNKAKNWKSSNTSIARVDKHGKIIAVAEGECNITVNSVDNPNVSAVCRVIVNAPLPSTELTYRDGILIVNKSYSLPNDFNPGINAEAKAALDKMFIAAQAEGCSMHVASGFRSYNTQKKLYENYVKRDGVKGADRYSARPGHSEHQTGLAFDINSANMGFADTNEAKWLAANSYKYGFILRYPEGKENVTGYKFEPWHYRYIGIDNAQKLFKSGLTIEEYFGLTSVYS